MSEDALAPAYEPTPTVSPIRVLHATPEIFAALAEAQAQARTVKKGGYNRHANYNYATAEDMLAAGKAYRRGTGLALLSSWVVSIDGDGRPWLVLWWLLVHGSGGMIEGSVNAPVQTSKRNGSDKQCAALATYLEGFVERGVLRLDREGTPPEEDRDSQEDVAEPDQAKIAAISAGVARLFGSEKWDDDAGDRACAALEAAGAEDPAALLSGWLRQLRAERVMRELRLAAETAAVESAVSEGTL